ncbi:MAG: hypothetical protein M1815_004359 [Lichina confinis]|nr:MAG: hypothetical protein M1815_004359 [Lichina confinis]
MASPGSSDHQDSETVQSSTTRNSTPLSNAIPPLLFGTATFTAQYNLDPRSLPTTKLIQSALSQDIRGFDTSPYYGPAEELLGQALHTKDVLDRYERHEYFLSTKVGRISGSKFDYSPAWVRHSIQRSLQRLKTSYVDLVLCHDVEFVSPEEVLAAVRELRRVRDETSGLKYVGISGYPVLSLCELAQMILQTTGEPLDAVMSYANFTLQNTTLQSVGVPCFQSAVVDVVLNASPLGMGLLRRTGVPVGAQGDFHPAENGLREACRAASQVCDQRGQKLESVALSFALKAWLADGAALGTRRRQQSNRADEDGQKRLGVSVIGVSSIEELDETVVKWQSILNEDVDPAVENLFGDIQEILGKWRDHAWQSPGPNYKRE